MADFYQAYQEVLETQEEKLRLELEEEKRIALSRLATERIEHERNVKERMEKIELEQLMLTCNKEILESEKKIVDENRKALKIEANTFATTSKQKNDYKLLEEINNIMQQPSQGNLHKVQLMVSGNFNCCFLYLLYLISRARK